MLQFAISGGQLRSGENPESFLVQTRSLAREGIDFLLLREKAIAWEELLQLAHQVVQHAGQMRVLVAASAPIALASGAAGVHLTGRPDEQTVAQVRESFPAAFVSVSCHRLEEVKRAAGEGADAVLFAPVFGKTVDGIKVVPAAGLELLRRACEVAGRLPVFALGGVTSTNASDCLAAGAAGVAGIRLFWPLAAARAQVRE